MVVSIIRTNTPVKNFKLGMTQDERDNLATDKPVGKGLTNRVRESLMRQKRAHFSFLMDCAIKYDLEGKAVTISELEIITGLSNHILKQGLSDPLVRVTYRKRAGRGRPEKVYHLPTKEDVRILVTPGIVGLSDHLPEWAYESLKNYRKARYYCLIARGCQHVLTDFVTYSRKFLCEVIGVSKATLIEYERELEMTVTQQFQETEINKNNIRLMEARHMGAYLEVVRGAVCDRIPAIRSLAHEALKVGAKVTLTQFLPNKYSLRGANPYDISDMRDQYHYG